MQSVLLTLMPAGVAVLSAWGGEKDNKGLVNVPSKYPAPETLGRLESVAKASGLTVFARIDFSGDADKAESRCARRYC
jgi:uncharacterized protein (DUF302 family)